MLDKERRNAEARRWMNFIAKQSSILMASLPSIPHQELEIPKAVLWDAATSYADDVARFTNYYQDVNKPNNIKQAAFTAKWIAFTKPIQLSKNFHENCSAQGKKECLQINEIFALHCACSHLRLAYSGIDSGLKEHLLYSLKHRYFTEHSLISIFTAWDLNKKAIMEQANKYRHSIENKKS